MLENRSLQSAEMRLWKTEFNSFIRAAQPIYCNQLVIVPLTVFHQMSETIGDPKAELIFIFNTARCGSTLLTQVGIISKYISQLISPLCYYLSVSACVF